VQYAILLVRVSVGLFFAISEADKLFVAARFHSNPREAPRCPWKGQGKGKGKAAS
jgi:hypothetical protein